jgi:hypothetical protein
MKWALSNRESMGRSEHCGVLLRQRWSMISFTPPVCDYLLTIDAQGGLAQCAWLAPRPMRTSTFWQ